MTTCQDNPLSASVGIAACEMTTTIDGDDDRLTRYQRCCAIMDILFSPFCGGCTGFDIGCFLVSAFFVAHFLTVSHYPASAACVALYMVLKQAQSVSRSRQLQLVQSLLCLLAVCFSAGCAECAPIHWLLLLATVGHLGIGLAMYETMRIGDCRRCMNEAHTCKCGNLKDPVPPGSLATLASAIEARWVPLAQRAD